MKFSVETFVTRIIFICIVYTAPTIATTAIVFIRDYLHKRSLRISPEEQARRSQAFKEYSDACIAYESAQARLMYLSTAIADSNIEGPQRDKIANACLELLKDLQAMRPRLPIFLTPPKR